MKDLPTQSLSVDSNCPRTWETRWKKRGITPKNRPAAIDIETAVIEPGAVAPPTVEPRSEELPPVVMSEADRAWWQGQGVDIAAEMLKQWTGDLVLPAREFADSLLTGPKLSELSGIDYAKLEKKTMEQAIRSYAMAYTGRATSPRPTIEALDPEPVTLPRKPPEPRDVGEYLDAVYNPAALQRTIARLVEDMTPHLDEIDAIAFRGSSGSAVGYTLGYLLKKPIIHVRKNTTDNHACNKVQGRYGARRVAIVDDFVASGETIRVLWRDLCEAYDARNYPRPELTHLFFYSASVFHCEERYRGLIGEIVAKSRIHLAHESIE